MSDSEGGSDFGDFDSASFPSDIDDTELYVFIADVSLKEQVNWFSVTFKNKY